MDRFDDDNLFAELRELRPKPRPEFTAELDERAAAGFPRGADTTASVFAPIVDWWRGMKPQRRLVPVLAVALAAVVVATGAVAISQSGGGSNVGEDASLGMVTSAPSMEEGGAAESTAGGEAVQAPKHGAGGDARHGAAIPEYELESSQETELPGANTGGAAGAESAGTEEAAPEEEGAGEEAAESREYGVEEGESSAEAVPAPGVSQETTKAPEGGRDIERSSYIVLGTKPGEVAGASAKVYEAVHAANGFVLSSSVQSGTTGPTGASFELSIPTRKIDDALAAISSIAEVRERHDATSDITAPTVSAAEELADSNAAIEGLLKQLGEAETEVEQESVERRLREERRHHAAIRASLDHLHKRASMSEVSVRIVTNDGAGVTPPSKDNGDWGVGDALHSAGHILTIAAGVSLIGLAVLAPFALIALLLWAANRVRVRRLRERTLG